MPRADAGVSVVSDVDDRRRGTWGAVDTIGRGVAAAPELREGFAITALLALFAAAGRVALPILIQQAIDRGLSGDSVDVGVVGRLAAVAAVAVVVSAVCQRRAILRLGRQAEEGLYGLRVRLFEHIHRLSIADHNDERTGALTTRVTGDVETLTQFFAWGAVTILLDITLLVVVSGVMLAYDWMLALVAFVVAAPLGVVLRRVQRHLVRANDRARQANADLAGQIGELASGAETLRAYRAGEHFAQATNDTSRRRSDGFIRANLIGAFLFPTGEIFGALCVSAVVAIGAWRGPGSGLTAGALVGFVFLTYRFLEPIAEFTEVLDQTQTAVTGLRRVLGLLETPVGPPESADPLPLPDGPLDVQVAHVEFRYPPRSIDDDEGPVLHDVTFQVPAGRQVAVVGETGSGKTTLGRLVARFADPTVGVVALGGVPLTRVANDDLRRRLVVVPQEPFLFDGTIAENLAFAVPGVDTPDLHAAIEGLDLGEWLATLPDGLATEVGQRGAHLSAGERQLVALVRASLVDPSVLVLDEATSSVDALTEVRIARALEHLASGRTTIAIAHRLSTAARADRVLVLDQGVLVEDGTHDELVRAGGVYARMFASWVHATASE